MKRSESGLVDTGSSEMSANGNVEDRDDSSSDLEAKEGESDYEPAMDSSPSQGDSQNSEDNKVKRASRVPKSLTSKQSADSCPRASRGTTCERESNKLQFKSPNNGQKRSRNSNKVSLKPKNLSQDDLEIDKVPAKPSSETSSELSEGTDERTAEDFKEIGVLDEAPNCYTSVGTDDETVDAEKNNGDSDMAGAYLKIGEMELKIEKLEEELREVAALEISLYSVVPEHGSSAHKVHTPARRLSRLYIYACKHWSPNKRATVAKNTASGLVLVAKSCGNDVPRLTFWLSNIAVLRQLISQTFGNRHSNPILRVAESNGSSKKRENPSPVKWKNSNNSKQSNGLSLKQLSDDWEETGTFTAALQRIESWIFSRIVESVWWQTLTPCMQTPLENFYLAKVFRKLSGQDLDDQQQGNLSLELWRSAFHDAFTRLCPVRAGGHECGCLPVLARLVMEQCISRLDVAMFNAILRESANEIPTDPVSDPIVDPQVLPIPSGDLSFGSGAQLKNSIGNWSRWLTDLFGVDTEDSIKDDQPNDEDDHRRGGESYSKFFHLLNELGDLLMLPKDMLLDKAIRKEVCPSIGLHLITRILCNFVPDEFCSDHVPGVVLEELKYESSLERRSIDKELINSFPCTASPVAYSPPSPSDIAQKVADGNGKAELNRRASIIQRKGYTSDEDLEDLDSPLTAIIDKTPMSSPSFGSKILKETAQTNARYRLLREIWSE